MKIAFIGFENSFDYFQIGGVESFVRRLAFGFNRERIEVDYILYGCAENKELRLGGLTFRYFKSLKDALGLVSRKYDQVITIYLLPKDRLRYAFFRRKHNGIKFHFIYFSWPDSLIKRRLYFAEARFFPYNGKLFCISKRQYEHVSKWAKNAVYLLPPVPTDYFLKPEEKPVNNRIKVNFLGRIDPRKGINEVINIFKELKRDNRFECTIYGIHIPEDISSLEIHNWLKSQEYLVYVEVDRKKYTPAVDDFVRDVLKETDIFIQPYQRLSSSIDTPLLLLEAMASLCTIITKPFGNISDIYGKSEFLISPDRFVQDSIKLLNNISYDVLFRERKIIFGQNLNLNFKNDKIVDFFLESIGR